MKNNKNIRFKSRLTKIIRNKVNLLCRRGTTSSKRNTDISLVELMSYREGNKKIPLCRLIQLLEFYGYSKEFIANQISTLNLIAYSASKKD